MRIDAGVRFALLVQRGKEIPWTHVASVGGLAAARPKGFVSGELR